MTDHTRLGRQLADEFPDASRLCDLRLARITRPLTALERAELRRLEQR